MELIKKELLKIVENIIQDGRKYNLIDRFFHYSIEEKRITSKIDAFDICEDDKGHLTAVLLADLYLLEYELKESIKKSFGISNFQAYSTTEKTTIIDNPYLLGISPFLFSKDEWIKFIVNDISKCKFISFYYFENLIMTSIKDSLNRLDRDKFIMRVTASKFTVYSDDGLFSLIVDDIFEFLENNETVALEQNNLVKNTAEIERIILDNYTTGDIVDRLIGSFKDKSVLNSNEKNEIRKFVSMLFVNKTGKRLKFREVLDIEFINANIKHLTETLKSKAKFELKSWTNKKVSELICNVSPNHFKLKTIENY